MYILHACTYARTHIYVYIYIFTHMHKVHVYLPIHIHIYIYIYNILVITGYRLAGLNISLVIYWYLDDDITLNLKYRIPSVNPVVQ